MEQYVFQKIFTYFLFTYVYLEEFLMWVYF